MKEGLMAVGVVHINLQSHLLNGFVFFILPKRFGNTKFYSTGLSVVITLQNDSFYSFSSTDWGGWGAGDDSC